MNAETAPTTEFATFAQTATGVAYANPSTTQSANVTLTVYDVTGNRIGVNRDLPSRTGCHLRPVLGISTSRDSPRSRHASHHQLGVNAAAFPVLSSLPPGDLPSSTLLVSP